MADFRELIKRIGQGARTVLLSSHLLGEVEQICTRAGIIAKGRLVAEGSIDELRGGSRLVIRASPADRAQAVLEQEVGAENVALADGALSVKVDVARAGAINRHMVEAGLEVTELRAGERSLEEVFMELTGTEGGL
jgi:ABC-2 type transport system ATP-binding protein